MHHEARMIKHAWQKADSSSIFTLAMKVMKHTDQFNIRMFMCIIQCSILQLYHYRKMLNTGNLVSNSTKQNFNGSRNLYSIASWAKQLILQKLFVRHYCEVKQFVMRNISEKWCNPRLAKLALINSGIVSHSSFHNQRFAFLYVSLFGNVSVFICQCEVIICESTSLQNKEWLLETYQL